MSHKNIFPTKAKWVWDNSQPNEYNYYLQARRTFRLSKTEWQHIRSLGFILMAITADSYYQLYVNGIVVGHGPAKSAESKRSVDSYDIAQLLSEGANVIDITVLHIGTGTMTYYPGVAGLIFTVWLPTQCIVSDEFTLVRRDMSRMHRTVRRWILPCVEDVNTAVTKRTWSRAYICNNKVQLYPRRVSLPSRKNVSAERIVRADHIRFPNLSMTFRIKPYLTSEEEYFRFNKFTSSALIVTDMWSPVAQKFQLTPAMGCVAWFFNNKMIISKLSHILSD